ncbi:Uncharacterized protein SCF082_LOCUS2283 [Durusdinium trenchii]|uniref:Uncharacterized protein n=1 Tax=Durusdinium trenchii TaxID=1381693 RepID=A0ABP0HK21_9DINO
MVLELFSGSSMLTQVAAELPGWGAYQPVDVILGAENDMAVKENRDRVKNMVMTLKPDLVVITPPCGPWCAWQRIRQDWDTLDEVRRKQLPFWKLGREVWDIQDSEGRLCLTEQPDGSEALETKYMIQRPTVYRVVVDQCVFGLKDPVSHKLYRKTTDLDVNKQSFAVGLAGVPRCSHQPREHEQIRGSIHLDGATVSRSTVAARWTKEFATYILQAAQKSLAAEALREQDPLEGDQTPTDGQPRQGSYPMELWGAYPVEAEPLLLARLTLEVQRFGRSSQAVRTRFGAVDEWGTRKFFQPMKGLQDPAWMPRIWTEGGSWHRLPVSMSCIELLDTSHVRLRDAPSEEDAQDLPRTCRRWWPDFQRPPVGAQLRREVRAAIRRQPERNNFAMWQMNFPATLPNGQRNPVCALGECGDPSCPTYRPKRPEVRQAVEQTILEKCQAHFRAGALKTYASIGCGLLGQDWIVLEQLRELGQLPKRAIFVELRTARPVITGEGAMFPRGGAGGGLNLRQTGFIGELGPEFAFSALLQFESECCGGLIFDFSNGSSDRIFAQLHTKPGALVFGAEGHSFVVEECWEANGQAHSYLFTVSAVGIYNVYRDGEIIARSYGPAPRCCRRQALYVGGRMGGGTAFKGRIQKIKVWDQDEVDPMATDLAYSHATQKMACGIGAAWKEPSSTLQVYLEELEVDNAHQTIAQWYKNEMDIYSFGSGLGLAGYAAACEKDRRFAADLLVKIDVHDELDGYDDFVCKALAPDGLALTLGGPGKSWRRSGTGWLPVPWRAGMRFYMS